MSLCRKNALDRSRIGIAVVFQNRLCLQIASALQSRFYLGIAAALRNRLRLEIAAALRDGYEADSFPNLFYLGRPRLGSLVRPI